EKTEHIIADSLLRFFIGIDDEKIVIKSSYKTDVYGLYQQVKDDQFIDIFELIKERDSSLAGYSRDKFSQIYIFFDYDGHSHRADDEHLDELISFFNEETENGKLFISYPMVECLRFISELSMDSGFVCEQVKIADCVNFKKTVHETAAVNFRDVTSYGPREWGLLVNLHCKKAKFIVDGKLEFPLDRLISQGEIFDKQKTGHIDVNQEVSVLSAFPLVVLDYYGSAKTHEMLLQYITH
ncbi:TPA: hypothetical protein ACSP3W_004102, partial [Aeromonas veronii]